MKRALLFIFLFFMNRIIESSDYTECILEANLDSIEESKPEYLKKKNKSMQKVKIEIIKVIEDLAGSGCDSFAKNKKVSVNLLFEPKTKLNIGKIIRVRFIHIVSEKVKNGRVSELNSNESWDLIEN